MIIMAVIINYKKGGAIMGMTKKERDFLIWLIEEYIHDCYFPPDPMADKIIDKLKKAVQ